MSVAIKIENISKQYRLGQVGTGTISHDLNRWWAKIRGKEDPYSKVGQVNQRDKAAESDYVWALKDINFEVEEGEVLGIIGANGAGKSTLLKIISRITSPTTGTIKAKGRIASLLEVGTGMHPEMTARENIYLNGAIMGMKRHEITRKFDDIIDFAGCRMYVDTPVKRFSSGMKVRLGFAVAAFLEPEILIVDEVLAVGDAEFQSKALDKMNSISRGHGRTVLFVSHNLASISALCTTALLINKGTAKKYESADSAITSYLETARDRTLGFYLNNDSQHNRAINKVELLNESGTRTYSLLTGEKFTIRVFLSTFSKDITGTIIGIAINSSSRQRLISFNSEGKWDEKSTTVDCRLPFIPLTPNVYYMSFSIKRPHAEEEYYEDVLKFKVVNSNVNGGTQGVRKGVCYVPASWYSVGGGATTDENK